MKANTNGMESSARVQNFRQAYSLPRIYRCASTDNLAAYFTSDDTNTNESDDDKQSLTISSGISKGDDIVLNKAGLILDLRSSSERDEIKARLWMKNAPGRIFEVRDANASNDNINSPTASKLKRTVLRIDVLSPSRLFDYLTQNWLTPAQKVLSALYFATDTNKLHELRMDVLNQRALSGLYEAMLETSQEELCMALKEITLFFESKMTHKNNDKDGTDNCTDAVVVHCVQGKDRTGIIVMLCQSILGLNDEEIIHDYHLSHQMKKTTKSKNDNLEGSAAGNRLVQTTSPKGKLDRNLFSGAPKIAMQETLAMLRTNYGSICPGYLDSIGFDEAWRSRFLKSLHSSDNNGNTAQMQFQSRL